MPSGVYIRESRPKIQIAPTPPRTDKVYQRTTWSVYQIYLIGQSDPVYIGRTSTPIEKRLARHFKNAKGKGSHPLWALIRSHGEDAFTVCAFKSGLDYSTACQLESQQIQITAARGVNLAQFFCTPKGNALQSSVFEQKNNRAKIVENFAYASHVTNHVRYAKIHTDCRFCECDTHPIFFAAQVRTEWFEESKKIFECDMCTSRFLTSRSLAIHSGRKHKGVV